MLTKINPIRWLLGLGYLGFGAVAFLFFIYVTFPFGLVQKKLIQAFEAGTNCRIQAGDQEVSIPFRLMWHDVRVFCPQGPEVDIPYIETSLALLPLLDHKGDIAFRVQLGDAALPRDEGAAGDETPVALKEAKGEFFGHLKIDPVEEGFAFSLKEEGVGLDLRHVGLSGILNMKGEGNWVGKDITSITGLFKGGGFLDFTLNDVQVDAEDSSDLSGLAALAGVSALSFSTVHGEMTWQKDTVSIGKFYAQGETAELTDFVGDIIVHEPFSASVVSMSFNIIPKGRLKQIAMLMIPNYSGQEPFTLVISGALTSPEVLINGKKFPTFS